MDTAQEPVLQPQRSVDEYSQLEDDSVKIVRIDKASEPLGATVKNDKGMVVIGRIVKGGAADKCGEKKQSYFGIHKLMLVSKESN